MRRACFKLQRNPTWARLTPSALRKKVMNLMATPCRPNGNGMPTSTKMGLLCRPQRLCKALLYPVVKEYKNLWNVPNLMLQKAPADNFVATIKLDFKPTTKYKGERTGLVVMGFSYAGLVLENTNDGIVLSQLECKNADKGTAGTNKQKPLN